MPNSKNEKSSINAHVEDALRNHIESTMPFNQAIMIDGKWGSGKTYFATSFIKKHPDTKIHLISLFGLKKTSDITATMIKECFGILKSAPVSIGLFFLKAVSRGTISLDSEEVSLSGSLGGLEKINEKAAALSKATFFFDDLERCEINIVELLGFLNQFIEKENCKVVLLTDEGQLTRKWVNETGASYPEMKEKIVRATYTLEPDFEQVFNATQLRLSKSEINKKLPVLKNTFKNVFDASESQNFRILQNSLWDFSKLFQNLSKEAQESDAFLSQIAKIFCILNTEHHLGALNASNFHQVILAIYPPTSLKSEDTILSKYKNCGELQLVLPKERWESIIFDKNISPDALKKEIKKTKYFIYNHSPNWKKLQNCFSLENDEFDTVLKQTLYSLKNKRVKSYDELLTTVNSIYSLMKHEIIPMNEDVWFWGKEAHYELLKKDIEDQLDELSPTDYSLYGQCDQFDIFFKQIKTDILKKNRQKANLLFLELKEQSHKDLIACIVTKKIYLPFVEPDNILDFILNTSNKNTDIIRHELYKLTSPGNPLFTKLKDKLNSEIEQPDMHGMKRHHLKEILHVVS